MAEVDRLSRRRVDVVATSLVKRIGAEGASSGQHRLPP